MTTTAMRRIRIGGALVLLGCASPSWAEAPRVVRPTAVTPGAAASRPARKAQGLWYGRVGRSGVPIFARPRAGAPLLARQHVERKMAFLPDARLRARGWLHRAEGGYVRARGVEILEPSRFHGTARPRHTAPIHEAPAAAPVPAPPAAPASLPVGPFVIPVEGVTRDQLIDSFAAVRSGGRAHEALDIPARRNTPVLAAAAGKVIRLQPNERGGLTISELSQDGQFVYYYAHLDHYAADLKEGDALAPGAVIGFVGDTGNPAPGNYHLHFAVWRIASLARYWEGTNLNPYLLLRQ